MGTFSEIPEAPITKERPVPENLGDVIKNPGAPRAAETVSAEHPDGIGKHVKELKGMTVLQRHMAFFDPDQDGVVWPWDTYTAFRKLDFDILLSLFAVLMINVTFSYATLDSWIPNLLFPIRYKARGYKLKHGSDSETYDTEGRFVPEKFEEVFSKYDRGNKGGLDLSDIMRLVKGNRNVFDPYGWTAAFLEWGVSYYLAAKETSRGKLLLKDDLCAIFDGCYFYDTAKEIEEGRLRRKSMFSAGLAKADPPKPRRKSIRTAPGAAQEKSTMTAYAERLTQSKEQ